MFLIITNQMAIMSMQTDYNTQLVRGLLLSYGLAVATHLIIIMFSRLVIRDRSDQNYAIDRFSIIYANCGSMGIPNRCSPIASRVRLTGGYRCPATL